MHLPRPSGQSHSPAPRNWRLRLRFIVFTAEIGKKKSIFCHCSILVNDCGEGEIPAHKAQFHWERDFPWKEPRRLVSDLGRETE